MAKKEINSTLDTMQKASNSIGYLKQLDDVTLNFQIIENGVPKNLTSQTIKLYVCKADKKIVEQTSGIQTVSAEEGKIKIDMLNAATQTEGIAFGEVVITGEGKTISTANFYFQVDRSIHNGEFIKSTNVIPLLDELESTLEDAKRKTDSISSFEKEAKEKEDERIKNETGRVEAEKNRVKEFTKWTDAKFLVDDSKITDSKTWSSKKIVDYVQSNDTTWTPKTIEGDGKADHTNNGYIKGLEIEGRTSEDGQGVGLKIKKGYKIGVKTHGKNLIDNKKIINFLISEDGNISSDNDITSHIIKCKEGEKYSLTTNGDRLRMSVIGEPIRVGAESLAHSNNGKITIPKNGEFLVITVNQTRNENLKTQLEENTQATKYEPYKESTQEIIIQQQLNTGDKLVFENGEYVIKTSGGQTVKTNVNNEMLPTTFDGVTYVEQDAGVKGTLKGQFPINSQAVITSLENRNKELEERLGQQEEMLATLYSFYRGTLEETEHIEEEIMTTEEL